MTTLKTLKKHKLAHDLIYYILRNSDEFDNTQKQIRIISGNEYTNVFLQNNQVENIDNLVEEFDNRSKLYKGTSQKLIAHTVISLAPNERITDEQWKKAMDIFVKAHGYQNAKYIGAVHLDTNIEHMHIAINRVGLDGKLVTDSLDYKKNEQAARRIEKDLGLSICISSHDTMDKNLSRKEKEALKDLDLDDKALVKDHAVVIRKRMNKFMNDPVLKPKTMSEFAECLTREKILFEVIADSNNNPTGIKYGIDKNRMITGSTIKKTRATWTALTKKEGVDYNPVRDNVALGLIAINTNTATEEVTSDLSTNDLQSNNLQSNNPPTTVSTTKNDFDIEKYEDDLQSKILPKNFSLECDSSAFKDFFGEDIEDDEPLFAELSTVPATQAPESVEYETITVSITLNLAATQIKRLEHSGLYFRKSNGYTILELMLNITKRLNMTKDDYELEKFLQSMKIIIELFFGKACKSIEKVENYEVPPKNIACYTYYQEKSQNEFISEFKGKFSWFKSKYKTDKLNELIKLNDN